MTAISLRADPARTALIVILVGAAATIGGALFFEYVIGLNPCELCLEQRKPYYAAIVLSAVLLALSGRVSPRIQAAGLILLGLIWVSGSALGVYHSGAEWHFWPGPTTCGGDAAFGLDKGDLVSALKNAKPVVSCTDVQWRFLGLSLAGYNALIAAGLALVAFAGAAFQGSSSVSQYR
jgi:disulfide bond formation protein DsbB